jgi:hypothetical protein
MKEYGGFLPLEINVEKEYYSDSELPILKLNSGRAAIYCALKKILPKCIYIPYYICESVYDVIKTLKIPIIKYFISDDFRPLINIEDKDCVLIVNYFGMLDSYINEVTQFGGNLIIDNTQAFFSKPIIKKGIYNIYSCRKFIGVSDGAYLIASELDKDDYYLKEEYSGKNSTHLLVSYEQGTNLAYKENLENESRFKDNFSLMSPLTKGLLSGANYDKIIKRRTDNWRCLHELLGEGNLLVNLMRYPVPGYVYPFLIKQDIREKLVEKNVYVSCLWKELLKDEFKGTNEYFFSRFLVPLPIDQRYCKDDMKELSKIVLETLEY